MGLVLFGPRSRGSCRRLRVRPPSGQQERAEFTANTTVDSPAPMVKESAVAFRAEVGVRGDVVGSWHRVTKCTSSLRCSIDGAGRLDV
jgi:hypothetical protein